jgi:hypothetical protein
MEGLETVASALLTLGLVAVAVVLSLYQRLDLEKDIGVAVVRSFLQLAAIGYVIDYVFGLENLGAVVLLLGGWSFSPDGRRRAGREAYPGLSSLRSGRSGWRPWQL